MADVGFRNTRNNAATPAIQVRNMARKRLCLKRQWKRHQKREKSKRAERCKEAFGMGGCDLFPEAHTFACVPSNTGRFLKTHAAHPLQNLKVRRKALFSNLDAISRHLQRLCSDVSPIAAGVSVNVAGCLALPTRDHP